MTRNRLPYKLLIASASLFLPVLRMLWADSGSASAEIVQPAGASHAAQALLFRDDFEDGDFTQAGAANGLTWNVVAGDAHVDSVDGSFQLGVERGISRVVTIQSIDMDEYTLRFDGRITWSTPGRILVLYKDENNYYSIGLGNQPGIYRKMNGSEVQLHADPQDLIRLPHGSAETGAFKIYVLRLID